MLKVPTACRAELLNRVRVDMSRRFLITTAARAAKAPREVARAENLFTIFGHVGKTVDHSGKLTIGSGRFAATSYFDLFDQCAPRNFSLLSEKWRFDAINSQRRTA